MAVIPSRVHQPIVHDAASGATSMSTHSKPSTHRTGNEPAGHSSSDRAFGNQSQSRMGQAAATITAVVSISALIWLVATVGIVRDHPDLSLKRVHETLVDRSDDGSCRWIVEFDLKNNTDMSAYIWAARLAVRQEGDSWLPPHGSDPDLVDTLLRPGKSAPARIQVDVPKCPSKARELSHEPMVVTYEMGTDRGKRIVIGF